MAVMFNKTSKLPELSNYYTQNNKGSFTTEEISRIRISSTTDIAHKLIPASSIFPKRDTIKQEISFTLFNSAKYSLDKNEIKTPK